MKNKYYITVLSILDQNYPVFGLLDQRAKSIITRWKVSEKYFVITSSAVITKEKFDSLKLEKNCQKLFFKSNQKQATKQTLQLSFLDNSFMLFNDPNRTIKILWNWHYKSNNKIQLLANNSLILISSNVSNKDNLILRKKLFYKAISELLTKELEIIQTFYEKQMNLPKIPIKIREKERTWGTFIRKKVNGKEECKIVYNLQLCLLPKELVEATVAHELTHYFYQNHGTNFYNHLTKYVENLEEKKKQKRNLLIKLT
ncbi:YgjP-like metallopeptidase domain-containing protein [Mycoplasmopsis iners]|uniref:YgjP-like metallopeptidase domain-containing protein n=1 Tax=Mycoplasmopsis iners TaxID=76630 RepID=UPI00049575B8|nr:YgjP-like metallopeptidase domain-containing protein [Mycoplasmopsis iners]